ncbi:response regulator [Pseudoroseomonas cervicalis]|uniref:response regulator n=1 Tax=Teichococcus cervicalis TaxID=204525 RepID=UPI002780B1AB|nr:response regulator [Pseudoroseomonas cervicalis]MDQ1079351.1 CheY-like chemotaxis protein [Pseudoroseomonas cervicalis]
MAEPLDPELLEAFLPEWLEGCATLAEAAAPEAAGRAMDRLSAMAAAFGIASLGGMLEAGRPLLEEGDPAGLGALAAALAAQAEAIGRAGTDLPPPETAPGQQPAIEAEEPAPPAATEAPRLRALVVDDSAMMRRLVRETLSGDPAFTVVGEAGDGRAALALMEALRPDLTMLDIEMPVLDGIGTLREWALSGHGAVVIVSSAARPGSELAALARRLGASAVVGKPSGAFSPDLRDRQGEAILRAARRATGLPALAGTEG